MRFITEELVSGETEWTRIGTVDTDYAPLESLEVEMDAWIRVVEGYDGPGRALKVDYEAREVAFELGYRLRFSYEDGPKAAPRFRAVSASYYQPVQEIYVPSRCRQFNPEPILTGGRYHLNQ